jgi:hypothetical protein
MPQVIRVDRSAAKRNPEASFASPQAVAEHLGLTRGEKLTALRRWREQVRHRLDSANEGMTPDPPSSEIEGHSADPVESDSELLRRIELELDALLESGDPR